MPASARMKKIAALFAVPVASIALAYFAFSTSVFAAQTVPYKLNFQGRLANATGAPLTGTYDMQLKLYTAVTGGTFIWGETRTAANSNAVTVSNGIFSVLIGEGTAVAGSSATLQAAITANQTMYLEVTVGAEVLTPRNQLGSNAFAINSDMLDGLDSSAFARLDTSATFTGTLGVNTASSTAFTVGSAGTALFTADTTNSVVKIGASDSTAQVVVLDANTADPAAGATSTNGAMYYNSTNNKFRCYQNGAWTDCVTGAATLQTAYDNSTSPATITTTASKGVKIAAGAVPTSDLFTIDNTGQAVTTAGTSGLQVTYVGGAAAVEASGVRVDLTPGTLTGGTWNGMRVVANATGAVSGVTQNGLKVEGPTTPGAGTEIGLNVGTGWDIGLDLNSGGLQLAAMNDPATPGANDMRVYAKLVAGRMMLKGLSPAGVSYAYQPSLFQQNVRMVTPGNGTTATTYTTIGGTVAVNGTLATVGATQPITQAMGSMSNIASTTTQYAGAGIQTTNLQYYRGSGGTNADGFFYAVRVNFSGNTSMALTNYNNTTTGARFFAGLTSLNITGNTTSMGLSASPTGHYAGFRYSAETDTAGKFVFMTNSGTATATTANTGVALDILKTYDFYVYCAPGGSVIYWRLDNLTDGTTAEGSANTNLPGATNAMRAGVALAPLSTTAINYRFQRMYVETDR